MLLFVREKNLCVLILAPLTAPAPDRSIGVHAQTYRVRLCPDRLVSYFPVPACIANDIVRWLVRGLQLWW